MSFDNTAALGSYGVKKIHQASQESLNHLDAQVYARVIAEAAKSTGATVLVFANNLSGKAVAPRVSARLQAGLVVESEQPPPRSLAFLPRSRH